MTGRLPPSASVATATSGDKLFAPSAERNADDICTLLTTLAPSSGRALELASGTGQHVVQFARAMPQLRWLPTEVDAKRRASIAAYATEAGLSNLDPPVALDASVAGWSRHHPNQALIVLINLLHLISREAAQTVVTEAARALDTGGCFVLYGPFMRAGALTSDGDARFHAQLSSADPAIGYKDGADVLAWLSAAGASTVHRVEMPANNLAFIAKR